MRARVISTYTCYYGEVFLHAQWKRVTVPCATKLGARWELKKWKFKNYPDEFTL